MVRRPRLDPEIFHLPVEKMREGYYSDKYFVRTRELLLKDDHRPCVTMQVFGKAHAFLGGIDEAIAILKLCSMEWPELEVYALYDGTRSRRGRRCSSSRARTTRSPTSRPCTSACSPAARRSGPTPGWSSKRPGRSR